MEPRTRSDYFESALELLAEGGAKQVTIANLCAHLEVTKGSFYHHFRSGPAFLRELLAYWEIEYGHRLVANAMATEDVSERLDVLKRQGANLRHEAESAIRALARTDSYAYEVQCRVDAERVEVIARTLREGGIARIDARRLARIGVAILIGVQQMDRPVDRRALQEMFNDYQDLLVQRIAERTAPRPVA
ncbi:MAG: TetR/AcrR family transcriptional regulator [Acidimicrobiales bacterium]